ncbi:MAG: hypothetical protein M0Z66_13325 [Thermaerobacter sp.]|nr:hypothetical protein [Thermaerobacter sp.]
MQVGSLMLPLERSLISPLATLEEAYTMLLDAHLTCLVLDEHPRGRIVRMRSILDHLAGSVLHGLRADPTRPVATLAEHVETVTRSQPVEVAAKALWRRPSRAVLVSDAQGTVIGLIGWPQLNQFFDEILDIDGAARIQFYLGDTPGQMARAFQAVADAGVNVRATYLSHPRDGQRSGTIYVPDASADAARKALLAQGFELV